MKNLTKTILIGLCCILSSNSIAQNNLSIGLGAGTTHFYGSYEDEYNISHLAYVEARYKFNNAFSTNISYTRAKLVACDLNADENTVKYFNTKTDNIDLHLQLNLMSFVQETATPRKLRVVLDMGPGVMLFSDRSYLLTNNNSVIEDELHNDNDYENSAYKIHFGGELGFDATERIEIFASILGNYCFTSDIDGYNIYNNQTTEAANDFFYTTTVGLRFKLGNISKTNDMDQVSE